MTQEEILEGNKLIAEFMGCVYHDKHPISEEIDYWEFISFIPYDGYGRVQTKDLAFHSSWDWLMPVWFKIIKWGKSEYGINWQQSIDVMFIIMKIHKGNFSISLLNKGEIEDVWFVVVEFIKWYNSCQKEK